MKIFFILIIQIGKHKNLTNNVIVLIPIVFLYFTQICSGIANKTTDSMRAEVQDKLHEGTPNLLLNLGDTLKKSLLQPTPDKNQGQQTLQGLHDYFNNLNDVYEMLKGSKKVEKKLGMKLFKMLDEAGGPPHIDIEFDIDDAMAKFEWNNRAVFSVREIIDNTEALWEKIQLEAEKLETL